VLRIRGSGIQCFFTPKSGSGIRFFWIPDPGSKTHISEGLEIIFEKKLEKYVIDQLGRASFSVPLNIAEGSGKFSKADRKNYFTIARASLFECVAVVDILKDSGRISEFEFEQMMKEADELSRILYAMIKNLT
jgi:four helix bundle protein